MTYAAIIVEYTLPTDYAVDFTSTFVSVTGSNLRLAYMCTTTDAEEQLTLTVGGSSSGTVACGGVATVKPVPGAAGQVAVRLQSVTVTGDATQSAYSFDSLYLVTDVEDHHTGDIVPPPFRCSYDWFPRSFSCRSTYAPPAGVEIVRISWALVRRAGNMTVSIAEGLQVRLPTSSPFWDVGPDDYTVSVVVIHTYGTFARSGPARDDDLPWLLIYVSLIMFAAAVLFVLFRRGPTEKSYRRNHRLPRVPSLYRQRAVDVDEYPRGWTSYRQYDPRSFKRFFSRRKEGKWIIYGVTKRGRILVQTVRVRKDGET